MIIHWNNATIAQHSTWWNVWNYSIALNVVYGPVQLCAAQVYRGGMQRGDVFRGGIQQGEVYQGGLQKGMAVPQ